MGPASYDLRMTGTNSILNGAQDLVNLDEANQSSFVAVSNDGKSYQDNDNDMSRSQRYPNQLPFMNTIPTSVPRARKSNA